MDSSAPVHPLIEVAQSEGVIAEYLWKPKKQHKASCF